MRELVVGLCKRSSAENRGLSPVVCPLLFVARVRALMQHPAFDLKNPNRVYALIRGFCGASPRHFHAADGSGYALAADVISELQAMNPQVASRIARSFDRWRQLDIGRQAHARAALERIAAVEGLAKDVAEVVGNALKG
jgi:aminopeptidase N